jgi:hypothetical protein
MSLLVRVFENLNRARFILLAKTTEESFSIVHYSNLRKYDTLFVAKSLLTLTGSTFTKLSNCFVGARCVYKRFVLTFRFEGCNARKSYTLHLVLPRRCVILVFQVPNKNVGIYTG